MRRTLRRRLRQAERWALGLPLAHFRALVAVWALVAWLWALALLRAFGG